MPTTYNILLMGASYGSLLASKLLFGVSAAAVLRTQRQPSAVSAF